MDALRVFRNANPAYNSLQPSWKSKIHVSTALIKLFGRCELLSLLELEDLIFAKLSEYN